MNFFKRTFLVILIALFVISIVKDLTIGTVITEPIPQQSTAKQEPETNDSEPEAEEEKRYQVVEVKVGPGDTVLSIIEEINHGGVLFPIEQIIADFETLNPDTDPHQIRTENNYYFPVYVEKR
ncbi:hypothetical protein [Sediminibacillus massiliensis]|uniref:hypothetical protein n=1 Tax=Sediminibacillus massiliensis TaxID=1926277 RepID=UPI0009887E04|nr:hypothetical protein [Sediminibacillus massiliensis]